jgi:ligand-binding sensor protein/AraC-like DNA-binding protein
LAAGIYKPQPSRSDSGAKEVTMDFFSLREIADNNFQLLQDSMSEVTGMAMITVDYKGIPVTKHSQCRKFCEFMRADATLAKLCQKCDSRGGLEAARLNKPYTYLCHADIVDIAIPILVEDRYLGAVMAGQVRLADAENPYGFERLLPDLKFEERVKADKMLCEYYKSFPVYTIEKIESSIRMIDHICKYIVGETVVKYMLCEMHGQLLNTGESGKALSDFKRIKEIKREINFIGNNVSDGRDERAYAPLVCMAINYIEDRSDRFVALHEAADYLYVSKSYLSRLFKKETGHNFSNFVMMQKMRIALEKLESTNKPIVEISDELGFNDCSYFIKCFKKIKGVTPAVYRNYMKMHEA